MVTGTRNSPRILITGGTGFVGSHIVQQLHDRHPEYNLTVLDIQPRAVWKQPDAKIKYIQANIANAEEVFKAITHASPYLIVHTAGVVPAGTARYGRRERDVVFDVNVNGTRNVLDAAKKCGAKAFIYTSSCTIITDDSRNDYPNMKETLPIPTSSLIYGQSKASPPATGYNHVC